MQTFANGIKHYIDTREIDEVQIPEKTAEEAMELLAEMGIVEPTVDENGSIFIEKNKVIYSL